MNQVRKIVHADYAHGQGIMGNGINIAIVDTGLSPHPDYRSRITGWYDAIHRNPFPYDDSGHGSHVAGIAAGDGSQSRGFYTGIAPKAGLVGVKVLDQQGNGTIADIMRGLDWILKNRRPLGIRIVNISIGSGEKKNFDETSDFVKKVDELWDSGLVVVAAAGNRGPGRFTVSAPGNSRRVITVGSHDSWRVPGKEEIRHSGAGPTRSCVKKPDVVAPGSRIISCSSYRQFQRGHFYSVKSGTSMSTPVVSGAIALLLEMSPQLSPKEIKIRLKNSSTDLSLPHEQQGWGLLNIERLL